MASTQDPVRRLRVAGEEIEFADQGDGEPILLVHGGVFSDWFLPMTHASQLAGYRLIRVRRAGFLDGTAPAAPLSFADHARHCALLLDALGLKDAHVCGHSSGALVALQLALDVPTAVRTLTLLEPAPAGDLAEPADGEAIGRLIGPAMAAAAAGDVDTAFDTFLETVGGSGGRALVERTLGTDGLQMAVGQARTLTNEVHAVTGWRFTSDDASRITQPLLLVQGGRSHELAPFAPNTIPALAAMAPHVRVVTLPGVTHLMPLQDPAGVAGLLADFIAEHVASDASNKRLDT